MKIALGRKLGLIILGVVLALAAVEAGFRAAGGLLSVGREARNRRGLSEAGAYRILCLGESTTQEQWPGPLEEELNRRGAGLKFKVIDKGLGGTYSGAILAQLNEYLETYRPHMVVVMMGINDGEWVWKNPAAYEDTWLVKAELFLKGLRLTKLATYIFDGLRADPKDPWTYFHLGESYRRKGEHAKAEKVYRDGIQAVPGNAWLYYALGNLYREKDNYKQAEEALKTGIEADRQNPHVYNALGNLYRENKEYEKAVRTFEAGIKAAPQDQWLYFDLGNLHGLAGEFDKAESAYRAGIKADPKNAHAYIELGNLYRKKGEYREAEKIYRAGIEADPANPQTYSELGNLYLMKGEKSKAEEVLARGQGAVGDLPKIRGALSLLSLARNAASGKKYDSKSYPPLVTIQNYQKLRDQILSRGMKLVCMQYPLRDAGVLEEILGKEGGILYVENKNNFAEAITAHGRKEIFEDNFGGDFGHCTALGNSLIAKNAADAILRELSASSAK
jgi:tetratricopeptide (TPR) repeat protein